MILGFLRSLSLNLLKLPMFLIGLPVVWLALNHTRKFVTDTGREIERLATWALPWDNAYDGINGDARLWWHNYCVEHYGKPATARLCQWLWTAVRNPANYYSRVTCGVDVSTLVIEHVAGGLHTDGRAPYRGWRLVVGKDSDGKTYPRFYMEWAITGTHGVMIDIGYKVKVSHNGTPSSAPEKDRLKGIVFALSPWKELS